jgi:hypothetical protein
VKSGSLKFKRWKVVAFVLFKLYSFRFTVL